MNSLTIDYKNGDYTQQCYEEEAEEELEYGEKYEDDLEYAHIDG